MTADNREALGRAAYDAEVAFGHEQAGAYTAREPWEALSPAVREMFMRVGSAVAAQAVADAKLRNDRMETRLLALGAHRAAIFDALRFTAEHQEFAARAKRYRAALEALGGSEEPS